MYNNDLNVYLNCNATFKSVPYGNDQPVSSTPSPEELKSEKSSTEHETTGSEACESEESTEGCNDKKLTLINQKMLNYLVRD